MFAFLLLAFLRQVLSRIMLFLQSRHDPCSSPLATKGVVCRSCGSFDGKTSLTPHAVEPAAAAPCEKVSQRARVTYSPLVEVCH